jgi:ABC-type oligopeptide transport system ATPase subunit
VEEFMSILSIQNLSKSFNVDKKIISVLDNVSLEIEKGDIFGVIGLSGEGKSTLVRCINLLEKPDSGIINYSKYDINGKLLDISDVDNQILLVIKDNKMIANIRGFHSENTYIETLYDVGFIDNLEDKLNELSYNEFKSLISGNNKNIVLLTQDNSADSEKVYDLLNQMVYNYDIDVNYINLEKNNSEVYQKVKNKLKEMEYEEVVSMPMVLIIESNKVVDYIVGNSTEEYFLDSFIENGVIKGDVIDE